MPMSWENLPETREGDSSRLWRCAGGSENMNKRDWLVNKTAWCSATDRS